MALLHVVAEKLANLTLLLQKSPLHEDIVPQIQWNNNTRSGSDGGSNLPQFVQHPALPEVGAGGTANPAAMEINATPTLIRTAKFKVSGLARLYARGRSTAGLGVMGISLRSVLGNSVPPHASACERQHRWP